MNRLHVARSFNLQIFEANTIDDLTHEQYMVFYQSLVDALAQNVESEKTSKTVSIINKIPGRR